VNIGSSWDATLTLQALLTVLCPKDESSFANQGHFSKILSDIFPQAAAAGSSAQDVL